MELRDRVRNLKSNGITYTAMTQKLGWGETTLYQWLVGTHHLRPQREKQLLELIEKLESII